MRALLIPLLLPVLLVSTSCTQAVLSAKAVDDRPASLKPAIATPVPAPPTIKSLAGTYKGAVDEQWLAKFLEEERKIGLGDKELKDLQSLPDTFLTIVKSHSMPIAGLTSRILTLRRYRAKSNLMASNLFSLIVQANRSALKQTPPSTFLRLWL